MAKQAAEVFEGDGPFKATRSPTKSSLGWQVTTDCNLCQREIKLVSEQRPNDLALGIAGMMICEQCGIEEDRASDRKKAAQLREERLRESNLPESLRGLEWADMIKTENRALPIDAARAWAGGTTAKGIYLFGSAGVGKTRLAATAVWSRLESLPVRWVSVAVLMANLDAAWGDKDRRQALATLTGEGALVLDDLDKVNPSERVKHHLYTAIDRRVAASRPLLVTANASLDHLSDRYGDSIASRLAGHCKGAIFELAGPDRRIEGEG